MTRLALLPVLALTTTLGVAAQTQTPEMSKEMKAVQGTWVLTTANGQPMDSSGSTVSVTITGDKYVQTADGQFVERGTMKIDGSKTPNTIDLMIAEGDDAGKTQLGVIQIGDGTVTAKLAAPGAPDRPKDFETTNDGTFTFTAKKVK